MKYLVSIIIPMYNAEKYIDRCIKSILVQTYNNIEIVVIDDGSTDESLQKIKMISDKRIKIYSQTNAGVSAARNLGIANAMGDYLLFVDADDYIDKSMVEDLVSKIDTDSTLVFCNNYEIWKKRIDKRVLFNGVDDCKLKKEDVLREIASGKAGLVCSKLVNSKVIKENNIKFDEKIVIGEDQIFFLEVAEHTKIFKYVNKYLYNYDRTNENSATIIYQKNLYNNFLRLYKQVKLIFKRNNLNLEEDKKLLNNKILNFVWICLNNEVNNLNFRSNIKNIKKILVLAEKDIEFELVDNNKINNLIISSINNKNNNLSILKIIIAIKLLNIKLNLISKVRLIR